MQTVRQMLNVPTATIAILLAGSVLCSAPASAASSKSSYSSSGKDAYVSFSTNDSCGYSGTYLDVSESMYKDSSGKSASNYGYIGLYSYNWCNGGYKYCYGSIDQSSFTKKGTQAQGTGSVTCDVYDNNGGYSSYTENITVDVSMTCSGDYAYSDKSKNTYTYSGPWGVQTYSYTGKGSSCDATATGSITGDIDTNITLGQADYSYGSLSDWKSKQVSVVKYTH